MALGPLLLLVFVRNKYARSSGENEAIPEKRQRSPLASNFFLFKNNKLKFGANSDCRNASFVERLTTRERSTQGRTKGEETNFFLCPFESKYGSIRTLNKALTNELDICIIRNFP